LITIVHKSTE